MCYHNSQLVQVIFGWQDASIVTRLCAEARLAAQQGKLPTPVQRRVDAAKEAKKTVDPKDETVRGSLPLFKLRSREDREQWRKLAFPAGETVQVGAEYRKYTSDSAIMATIILDLQPFNQVNR